MPDATTATVAHSPEGSAPDGWLPYVRASRWALFAAIALFALILRLACLTGLAGSDDLGYSKYARAMAAGTYNAMLDAEPRRHHGLRFSVIAPVAVIYEAFGVSEWTTILFPLLASTLSIVALAEVGRLMFGMRVGVIAALLYATFPIQLMMGSTLLPEPIAGFYALLGIICYLHARQRGGAWWIAAGVLMGVAYLAKESALFIGGAFLLHAVWERQWRGALLFACGVAAIGVAEHAYYFFWKGDLLYRPNSTRLYKVPEVQSFFTPTQRNLTYRLFSKYPEMMLVPSVKFGLHSLVCLIGAAAAFRFRPRAGYAMLLLWAVVPWLYLNFGTWSLNVYAPLPTDERYIECTYPPLILLTATVFSRALGAPPTVSRPAAALMGVVMATGLAAGLQGKGTIGKAPEMTVLREIVKAVQQVPGQAIYTEDTRWQRALEVFDASLLSPTPDGATVWLTTDALGFPAVKAAMGGAPPEGR
jgi:4-amino-4-deoxy-L-arabinose transferase-like glycosyltransferase